MRVKTWKPDISGKVRANRKEQHFSHQYTVYDPEGHELVTARIYSTNARNYACIWLHIPREFSSSAIAGIRHEGMYNCGGGFAGGYGYHRPSQALQCAINDAGIELDTDIAGRGDSAMDEALLAIAKAFVNPKRREKLFIGKAHA